MTYFIRALTQEELDKRKSNIYFGHRGVYRQGANSPIVHNRPKLRGNPYEHINWQIHDFGFRLTKSGSVVHGLNFDFSLVDGKRVPLSWCQVGEGSEGISVSTTPSPLSENELNTLRSELQKRVNYSSMELLVTLKEMDRTVSMIYDRMRKLSDIYAALRGRRMDLVWDALGIEANDRKRKRRIHKQKHYEYQRRPNTGEKIGGLSGVYLEYLFGWSQIYKDIMSGCRLIADTLERLPKERASTDVLEKVNVTTRTFPLNGVSNIHYVRAHATRTSKYKMHARFKPTFSTFLDAAGLNIPSALWQIQPSSFVLDWFLDVNSFLGQFMTLSSFAEFECQITQSCEVLITYDGKFKEVFYKPDNSLSITNHTSHGSAHCFTMTRKHVSPYMSFPPARIPTEIGKGITATALILQRLGSLKRG